MKQFNLDQPLVYDKVEFEKEAATELPVDESKWIIAIDREAQEQIPALSSFDYKIDLKKTQNDKGQGYGYGAIVSQKFTIPLIIKNGRLQDLDVFLDERGVAWPIKNNYFEEYISAHNTDNIGKTVSKKKGQVPPLNLLNRMQSPSMPRYSRTGPLQERATLAEDKILTKKLSKTEEEITKIAEKLKNDSELLATYKYNKNDRILKYAMQDGESADKSNPEPKDVDDDAFEINPGKRAMPITESGVYIVRGSDGSYMKGNIISEVFGFDMKPKDYMIACDLRGKNGDTKYAIQSEIAGVKVGDLPSNKLSYLSEKFGVFVCEKDGAFFVFEPVYKLSRKIYSEERKVTIISDDSSDERAEVTKHGRTCEYLVQDMMGNQFKIFTGGNYNGVIVRDGNVYANKDIISFRGLGESKVNLVANPAVINEHIKAKISTPPSTVKLAGEILSINEPWASENLRAGTHVKFAKEELKKHYTESSIDNIIKAAQEKGRIQINSPSIKKSKRIIYENVPSFDTVKIASVMPDDDTVDKVLSLNFLNPENVEKFVSYLPDLRRCMNKLADLLLASRMGINVPSIPIKVAMEGLAKTVMYLKSIKKGDNQYAIEDS